MNTLTYAAIASIVALVPIFYVWSRNRGRSPPPSVKLEVFPATCPPSGPVVVVTGGSGFVGRRIIELLLQHPQQYRVKVLDVLLPVVKHASVTYVRGDICNPEHVAAAFAGADAVLHVASIIPSLKTQASPIIHRVNVEGTRVVIDACKARRPLSMSAGCSHAHLTAGMQRATPHLHLLCHHRHRVPPPARHRLCVARMSLKAVAAPKTST